MKNWYFIIIAVLVIFYIVHSIRKDRLSIKTSFGWSMATLIMLILAIFPYSLDWLADLIGISYPPALFLTLCVVVLIVIDFNYSRKLEDMQKKINYLAQEVSILRSNSDEIKK